MQMNKFIFNLRHNIKIHEVEITVTREQHVFFIQGTARYIFNVDKETN